MTRHPASDPGASSANYDLLDRLANEFAERFRRGERPSLKEYTDRHPELAEEIKSLFPALVDLEQADEVRLEGAEDPSGAEPPPPSPALAQVGDYQVLREIGRGGMGVVYEAEQVSLGRRVALKILPHHVARDSKMLERFRREARAAARLHHTNIVPVFEVGREREICYYAMQFIQGQGLDLVYDELRRLRGRAKDKPETGAPSPRGGPATHVDQATVGQVVHSLLTGRFGDETLPAPVGNVAGQSVPEWPIGDLAPGADPALDRTEADSATGAREKGSAPTPAPPGHAELAASSTVSAVMPGGSQISTVESGRREYPRSIARIGLQAAQGLAYAHARGVIHRDIKPSNLLLDTAGVVWITDFGLAKADGDALTQTGDILGTLRYMAPERFSGTGDARADVYALGLTLYELLTLEPAFKATDRLRLIEQIKSVDPVRPRVVDRRLPRDLETVILKAIDKDSRRRYQTADEFAEDLRRFRDDEPILARRATAVERTARWARRNPAVAVLGGVLTGVLMLVTAASLVVAGRMATLAERQRQTADSERVARLAESDARLHEAALRKQAEQARRDAEAALAETQVERNRAEENFQRARAVVDQYFTQVSESQLLSVPGLQTLRRDLLRSALSFYTDYLTRRGQDPDLRAALAAVHLKAAKIHLELGDRASAEKDYRGALPLFEALARAVPADAEARNGLAECHYGLGMCGPAGKSRRDALFRSATIRQELAAARPTDTRLREDLARSYQALGESQWSDKQVKDALDSFLKARAIAASLVGDHPDDPAYRHDFARNLAQIAECLCNLARHKDETIVRPMAIDHARAAYEQAPQVVAYGRLYGHLLMREGDNLGSQGRYEESARSLRQAVQVEEKLIRENPAVPDLARELAATYIEIVANLPPERRASDPVPLLRQACELMEALPLRGPDQLYALAQLLALRASKPDPARPRDEDEERRHRDFDLAAQALGRAIAGGFRDINELRSRARAYFPSLLARPEVTAMLTELEARVKDEGPARETSPSGDETAKSTAAARDVRKTQGAAATDSAYRRLQADLAASEHAIALIHFEMGKTLHAKGDFDGALAEFREAVVLRPDDATFRGQLEATLKATADRDSALAALRREAAGLKPGDFAGHLGLARRMVEKKDLDGAVAEFREAIRIEPDNPDPHKDLAALLRDRGDPDGALAERRELVRLTPDDPQAHVSLGIALNTKRDLEGALVAFRDAVRLNPDDANSHDWIGFLLEAKEDHDGAIIELHEAIRINPNHVSAHRNLGRALLAKGDKAGAIAEFRAVVQLKPSDALSRNRLVDTLKDAGDTAGAEAVLREAKTRDDNFARQLEIAQNLWDKKDLPGAVRAFRMAVGLKPDNADAQRKLGETLRQTGEDDAAIVAFRAAMRLGPDYGSTHNNYGLALEKKGDLDGAIAEFRAAIRIDGGRYSTQHNNLSRALLARHDLDGAVAEAREAVRLQTDSVLAQRQLGYALVKRGNLDEARAALGAAWPDPGLALAEYANALRRAGMIDLALAAARESVRLAPSSERAHQILGWALLGKRDWAGSAAAYRESIRLHPDNYSTHHQLGIALVGLTDWDGAIPAFREALRLNPVYAPALDSLIAALAARRKRDAALATAFSAIPRRNRNLAAALDTLTAPLLTRIHPDEGIAVLDDLIRDHPKQTRFRVARAKSLIALGRPEEAAAEFAQALPLVPAEDPWRGDDPTGVYPAAAADPEVFERLTQLRPGDRNLWTARLRHLGRQREWRQAAEVATRINALDRANGWPWFHAEATFLAWVSDIEGYRRVCHTMLERFGTSDKPVQVAQVVFSCLLEPTGVADLGELAPLVDRFAGAAPANLDAFAILAEGLYEYREGRYRAALDRLRPLPEALTTIAPDQSIRAMACVIRAMACQKLDQGDEARRQLTVAEAQAKPANFDPGRAGPLPGGWSNWICYHTLRREAEALIHDAAVPGELKGQ